ncbi:MAG TPA: response regulator [Halanaerobiales bacterium]|nr:response regulator [Halanaerobiales bacterium]
MLKIMLVDDSLFMINHMEKILRKYNHHVIAKARNGQEAIEKYKKHQPDLVFLDINMSIMKGTEALKKIIEYDKEANVVICSSMGQKYYIKEAINNGAKDFVIKPFNEKRIRRILVRFIINKYKKKSKC